MSQIFAIVGDHSRHMKTQICTFRTSAMVFSSFPILYIACFNFLRTFHFPPKSLSGESRTSIWPFSDMTAKSGKVGKLRNPRSSGIFLPCKQSLSFACSILASVKKKTKGGSARRVGFSRHMKTRLYMN